ncbi:hypothetical protein JR334_07630 [Clostridia bacterium]|nr:hypothetical protein JR334_07630 [Clostridia bacterium]
MKKLLVVIFIILLATGCSEQQKIDEQTAPLNAQIETQAEYIKELEERVEHREEELEDLSVVIGELTRPVDNSVYSKGFNERKFEYLPRAMHVAGPTYLRTHPYDEAAALRKSTNAPWPLKEKDVIIHALVRNEDGEDWVLVEYPDLTNYLNNFGYVPLDSLKEVEYSASLSDDTESIAGVKIGDIFEKAVVVWGDEYNKSNGPNMMGYSFGDEAVAGVDLDPIKNTIMSIFVRTKGFCTKEGVMVGDSAKEVMQIYEKKYERNVDGKLYEERSEYIFKLNDDGYVIEFRLNENDISYENLSDEIITSMSIYNIYVGDA